MPSSPSMPGTWTESTSSEYASRSGVTISSSNGIVRTSRVQALGVLADVVDGAGEEEGLLGQRVDLALEDLLEARDGVLDRDVGARPTGEHLGDRERLRREPLEPAGSRDGRLVLFRQLVDPEDRDDVLQVAVALEHALRLLRDVVVLGTDDVRVEDRGRRGQRVDRGVDAQLRDGALEADRRVEVAERRGGGGGGGGGRGGGQR